MKILNITYDTTEIEENGQQITGLAVQQLADHLNV